MIFGFAFQRYGKGKLGFLKEYETLPKAIRVSSQLM